MAMTVLFLPRLGLGPHDFAEPRASTAPPQLLRVVGVARLQW